MPEIIFSNQEVREKCLTGNNFLLCGANTTKSFKVILMSNLWRMKETFLRSIHLMTEVKFSAYFVQLKSQQGCNIKKVNLKITAREPTRNNKFRVIYVNNQAQ